MVRLVEEERLRLTKGSADDPESQS
jgi:hypothetical protein